jgi:hypothetical protein
VYDLLSAPAAAELRHLTGLRGKQYFYHKAYQLRGLPAQPKCPGGVDGCVRTARDLTIL